MSVKYCYSIVQKCHCDPDNMGERVEVDNADYSLDDMFFSVIEYRIYRDNNDDFTPIVKIRKFCDCHALPANAVLSPTQFQEILQQLLPSII